MRPARTHGSAHQGDLVARPSQAAPRQRARWAQAAAPAQRAVRAVVVVMVDILGQYRPQLPAAHDQHPIQQLPPDGADPPLGVGVGPRCPHRRAQYPDSLGREDRVERVVNFVFRSRSSNRKRPPRSSSTMSRLRACWVTHAPAGCGVTRARGPGGWPLRSRTAPTAGCRNTVSTVKQVHCRHAVGLGGEELPPGQRRPLGRRFDAGPLQDGPDRAGPNPEAQAAQLSVDATVAPGRVLLGQPHHQRPTFARHRRAAAPVRVPPAASDQILMPAQ